MRAAYIGPNIFGDVCVLTRVSSSGFYSFLRYEGEGFGLRLQRFEVWVWRLRGLGSPQEKCRRGPACNFHLHGGLDYFLLVPTVVLLRDPFALARPK